MRKLIVPTLLLAVLVLPAAAQDDLLPEGPGRDVTARACSGCHSVDFIPNVARSRMAWENTMLRMMNRGMKLSTEDYFIVANYLATYAGLSPPPAPAPAPQAPAPGGP